MKYFQRVHIIDESRHVCLYTLSVRCNGWKPEGDIAVTPLLLPSIALSSDGVWRVKRAEAVGLNLLEFFPSGLGTPAHPASVEGRERFGYGRIQETPAELNARPSMSA